MIRERSGLIERYEGRRIGYLDQFRGWPMKSFDDHLAERAAGVVADQGDVGEVERGEESSPFVAIPTPFQP